MKVYSLCRVQRLPVPLEKAWEFFSAPANLRALTPPHIKLALLSDPASLQSMRRGQLIRYKISLLPFIYFKWTSEITELEERNYFIDEQPQGPFASWKHKHSFKQVEGGTEMTDELYYALPLGILGRAAHTLFVRRQVEAIFDFRYKALEDIFGRWPAPKFSG